MAHDQNALSVVDFARTGRRLGRMLLALAVAALVLWPIVGSMRGTDVTLGVLGELLGWALLVAVVLEILIVGGSALVGMLRAGSRGDRLARPDVSLVPPQLTRRRRRRAGN